MWPVILSYLSCTGWFDSNTDTATQQASAPPVSPAPTPAPVAPATTESSYRKIDPKKDAALLAGLGYRDTNNNGQISMGEVTGTTSRTSFNSIAALTGDTTTVDAGDLDLLRKDSKALAQIIRTNDPYTSLREKAVVGSGREKKFLTTLVQLSLEKMGTKKFLTYGTYGDQTIEAMAQFQKSANLDPRKHKSSEVDPATLGALLLNLEHPVDELVSQLVSIYKGLNGGSFYLNESGGNVGPSQLAVFQAFQHLHPDLLPPFYSAIKGQRLDDAQKILSSKYSSQIVGENSLKQIINDLKPGTLSDDSRVAVVK